MANEEHVAQLKQGAAVWNAWRLSVEEDMRRRNPGQAVLLSDESLTMAELEKLQELQTLDADLSGADLSGANLSDANLSDANLSNANLSHANLSGANLVVANLVVANLSNTNLSNANLSGANLSFTKLSKADLTHTNLSMTVFAFVDDLGNAIGLDTCSHLIPILKLTDRRRPSRGVRWT